MRSGWLLVPRAPKHHERHVVGAPLHQSLRYRKKPLPLIDTDSFRKGWSLLTPQEKRNAFKVMGVMMLGARGSAAMVGAIFPFLTVLADPGVIQRNALLSWAYAAFGFRSDYGFVLALGGAA